MINLPESATPESRRRAQIAAVLAANCPAQIGGIACDEIALTGSTARGLADAESDLELNFWSAAIPSGEARAALLRESGAADVRVIEAPRSDDSYWVSGVIDGVPVEIGWQTFAALDAQIAALLSGEVTDRKALALGEVIASARPLRTNGWFADRQASLRAYPDRLQAAVIAEAAGRWTPAHFAQEARLARRGELLALYDLLIGDFDAMLRLLYAVNRRWEPSRKWTLSAARDLALGPADLEARLHALFAEPPEDAVCTAGHLIDQALALVPAGVADAAVRAARGALLDL